MMTSFHCSQYEHCFHDMDMSLLIKYRTPFIQSCSRVCVSLNLNTHTPYLKDIIQSCHFKFMAIKCTNAQLLLPSNAAQIPAKIVRTSQTTQHNTFRCLVLIAKHLQFGFVNIKTAEYRTLYLLSYSEEKPCK